VLLPASCGCGALAADRTRASMARVLGTVVTVPVIVSEGWKTARNQRFLFDVPCCLAYAQVVGTTRGGQEG